jgi:hypothetical protein
VFGGQEDPGPVTGGQEGSVPFSCVHEDPGPGSGGHEGPGETSARQGDPEPVAGEEAQEMWCRAKGGTSTENNSIWAVEEEAIPRCP